MAPVTISPALSSDDLVQAASLMDAYKDWLGRGLFDNPWQRADETLPGPYGQPGAGIFLAWRGETAVGVVAYKDLGDGISEMKRLFVSPEGRGTGAGRALSIAVMEAARTDGYKRMVLDTLPRLTAACALYEDLGFTQIPRYNENPVDTVRFYGIDL